MITEMKLAQMRKCIALLPPPGDLVANELLDEIDRLRSNLAKAIDRMQRTRHILTNGSPSPSRNWGMLDTSDLEDQS